MRVKLENGMQSKLIYLAKGDSPWSNLSIKLGINSNYLSGDLRREKTLLSEEIYLNLCKISGKNFNKFIKARLHERWGQSKGGFVSKGSTLNLKIPEYCEDLAEFMGAVLGDGHVHYTKKDLRNKKIGVYQIKIAGHFELDREYHQYLKNLAKSLFELDGKFILYKPHNERFLSLSSKKLVEFIMSMGINPGNKIVNQSTVPSWVFNDVKYMRACIRGLIDTDGCIHRMSKKDSHLLRINFKNNDFTLLNDARKIFILLGFNPSKIICGNVFYISRQNEIDKYLKEIGFSNKKHLDRLNNFRSPVV